MLERLKLSSKLAAGGVLWFCLLFLLAACGDDAPATLTPVVAAPSVTVTSQATVTIKDQWDATINEARQKWEARNIQNYELELTFMYGSWQPIQSFHLTVKNNQVVEHAKQLTSSLAGSTITPGPIRSDAEAAAYTISGLFDMAQSMGKVDWAAEDKKLEVKFNPTYGFPTKITLDSNRFSDVQVIWEVKSFKAL